MTCTKKALVVMMLTTLLGLWGCTQSSSPSSGSARLRELEAKTARLEDDYKTAVSARDQARRKVSGLEEQRAQLVLEVEQLAARCQGTRRTQASDRPAHRGARRPAREFDSV